MEMKLNLFEQLVIWMCRNKKSPFTLRSKFYNCRVYMQGQFTFIETGDNEVEIMGINFYYKATTLEELIKFVNGIEE